MLTRSVRKNFSASTLELRRIGEVDGFRAGRSGRAGAERGEDRSALADGVFAFGHLQVAIFLVGVRRRLQEADVVLVAVEIFGKDAAQVLGLGFVEID